MYGPLVHFLTCIHLQLNIHIYIYIYTLILYIFSLSYAATGFITWALAKGVKPAYILTIYEKSKIPFSYMLYAYSVKRAYRGTKPKESFR